MSIPSLLKVVVDRAKWYRGKGANGSQLLRPEDHKMCCIGFACLAAGMTRNDIVGWSVVANSGSTSSLPKAPVSWGDVNGNEFAKLYADNDNDSITDPEREARLIEGGKKCGIDFEFVN